MILLALLATAGAVAALDAGTKSLAVARPGTAINVRGSVSGLGVRAVSLLLGVVTVGCVVLALVAGAVGFAVGLGMVLGGAGGNVVDRIRRGGVVDFVSAGWWPTFNLADAAMVAGVLLCLWSLR